MRHRSTTGTGLQPGDVIYPVNKAPVATVEALRKKVEESNQATKWPCRSNGLDGLCTVPQ